MVIMRSILGKGNRKTVQYVTAWQASTSLPVLRETSPFAGADITLSSGSNKGQYVATLCLSKGIWYQQFATGINACMGDIVSQDRAYTIEVLLVLPSLRMYKEEQQHYGYKYKFPMQSVCSYVPIC